MQYELRELQQRLGITFVFVTHDQKKRRGYERLDFVMNDGDCAVRDTCWYIWWTYQSLCSDVYQGINILPGKMIEDYLVRWI